MTAIAEKAYGVNNGDKCYEPADADLPSEHRWSTELYLNHVPQLFEKLRLEFGDELHLLHDVHHRLTPIEAGRLGKSLEPYHLFWLEDAVAAENQESFRLIREHTTTPLAGGEVFPHAYTIKEGYMQPGETPGHGVDIDEILAAKYPYKRAYLPVTRLTDGSMTNW